ncbi:MAG: hypothetical protein M4579_006288 [Chaenotheca gracillima]|nr:MAG: hypothetical protein M4579_006288 [Chaenotheca gracillima]
MGGQAFKQPGQNGEPGLYTPRMSPEAYYRLREKAIRILADGFYENVVAPIDAPEKETFGDIDLLVQGPLTDFTADDLAHALGAERHITQKNSPLTSFAIWDGYVEIVSPIGDVNRDAGSSAPSQVQVDSPYAEGGGIQGELRGPKESSSSRKSVYRQLDVQVCPAEDFAWGFFRQSHGDLWNLLGRLIQPYGLTVTTIAMLIRVPEIEETNRKESFLHLTNDPRKALEFLGLSPEPYWRPFDRVDNLFDYVSSTRFFHFPQEANEGSSLKARKKSDLIKKMQRPLYRRWFDEYLPSLAEKSRATSHGAADRPQTEKIDREEVLHEALNTFNKQEEYDLMVSTWHSARIRREAWSKVAAAIPLEPGDRLNLVLRGLRHRISLERGVTPEVVDMDHVPTFIIPAVPEVSTRTDVKADRNDASAVDHDGQERGGEESRPRKRNRQSQPETVDVPALEAWVMQNWEEVRLLEKTRVKKAKEERKIARDGCVLDAAVGGPS